MEFLTTGNTLMASVGTATGETVSNLLPVVAVVGGIILAFVGVRFIISLIKSTGKSKA
jgi:putative Mn2+ efflux pump MntP